MRRNELWIHGIWLAGLTLVGCSAPAPEPEAATAEDDANAAAPRGSWRQWGGPTGDFRLPAAGLAATWPEEGPRVIWNRPLGEGYSAVSADGGTLFTMYRDGDDDVIIALRAADGVTRWEQRYHAPTRPQNTVEFGKGPNATPLVVDNRVVTLGYSGQLNGLDRDTGSMIWSVDLIEDLDGEVLTFGHSASPIAHDGKVLVLVGGDRHGLVAFPNTRDPSAMPTLSNKSNGTRNRRHWKSKNSEPKNTAKNTAINFGEPRDGDLNSRSQKQYSSYFLLADTGDSRILVCRALDIFNWL